MLANVLSAAFTVERTLTRHEHSLLVHVMQPLHLFNWESNGNNLRLQAVIFIDYFKKYWDFLRVKKERKKKAETDSKLHQQNCRHLDLWFLQEKDWYCHMDAAILTLYTQVHWITFHLSPINNTFEMKRTKYYYYLTISNK